MELRSYQFCFTVLYILLVLRDCAPLNQDQLVDFTSELKEDLQKTRYMDLPSLPYSGKDRANNAVDNFDTADLESLPDKGKRLPPLPWNKRPPALPWDKKASKRPIPLLPWNKRLSFDDDIDREEYLQELMKLMEEWESQENPEKRLPPLPWNKRLPPLPWNKRIPPLPWNKRLPPLPWNKRVPPLPWNKRIPPLPWNKRVPPLPWNKRVPPLPWNKRIPPLPWTKRIPPLPWNKSPDDTVGSNDMESLGNTLYMTLQDLEKQRDGLPNDRIADYTSLQHLLQMTHSIHPDRT